ncbi:hypothetical protein [Actinoplanes couchii]|uniref:hypothetical protein n=1 Tax=Actinoplanes couchii TaxID=403638 RepID=UPI00194092B6|nr:hypothetical protein [Actinoplanes couchii]MDR6322666.1 hypothetical protein [Actinoplanes couchii]
MGLSELREVPARRAAIDAVELESIDRARRSGASWAQIASALGLASRQAAEQRRQRLAEAAERASRPQRRKLDRDYGPNVSNLRERAVELHRRIGADRRWDRRFTRAALVRETLAATPDAPAGALYDLVVVALADLSGPDVPVFPGPLRSAIARLRAAAVVG